MVLSQDQLKEVEAGMVDIQNGFAASKRRQWPLPIAYEFDPSIGLTSELSFYYMYPKCIRFSFSNCPLLILAYLALILYGFSTVSKYE